MTDHDIALINEARRTPFEFMDALADRCESEEAKGEIYAMQRSLYHRFND